jgi:NTP pyrophosphatase (non-canonical NTP hydrolase)
MSQIIQPGQEMSPNNSVKLSLEINPTTGELRAVGGDKIPGLQGAEDQYIGLKVISDMFNSIMTFNKYQQLAAKTAVYPEQYRVSYPALGLAGEAGEVCEKIKRIYRDDEGKLTEERREEISKELGDVLWYIAILARDVGIPFEKIAQENLQKLFKRMEEDKLKGEGDNR